MDYEDDIFISYAHLDDEPFAEGQRGWVQLLYERLSKRLAQLLGEPAKIWRDPKLPRLDELSGVLVQKISRVALLVPILSPRYLNSEWCLRELDEFCRRAELHGGLTVDGKSRVFKVMKTFTPRQSHPPQLQGLLGYEFYEYDEISGRTREFSPEIDPNRDSRYWEKLEDLAWDIKQQIETLRSAPRETAALRDGGEIRPIDSSAAAIYVAETTNDLSEQRDKIKRELHQHGHQVLPDKELPLSAPAIQEAVREYLKRSRLSVHLIGEYYGTIPEMESERSIVRLQHELAMERGDNAEFPRLIWMPPGLQPRDERQQEFVDDLRNSFTSDNGSELLQGRLEDLKNIIQTKLAKKPKLAHIASAEAGAASTPLRRDRDDVDGLDGAFLRFNHPATPLTPDREDVEGGDHPNKHHPSPACVYLVYDEHDYPEIKPISKYLYEQEFEVLLPVDRKRPRDFEEHKELMLLADAVMVFYGRVSDVWTRQKLRELQKLQSFGREKPLLAKAFYLSSPPTEDKEDFRTYEAMIIRGYQGFEPELLSGFVNQVRSGLLHVGNSETTGRTEKPMAAAHETIRLFYSYSHKDDTLRDELEKHLKLLQRQGVIEAWSDRKIGAGDEWETEIDENLEQAHIILLLVSADFLASDYCFEKEVARALKRHENKEARVIPVIVRDVNWRGAPFSKLQALPKNGKAVTLWADRDTAWRSVSEGIEIVVENMRIKSVGRAKEQE